MLEKLFFILFTCVIGIFSFFGGYFHGLNQNIPIKIIPVPTPTLISLDTYKIYTLINDYRSSQGLNKLFLDQDMCTFTQTRLLQIHSDYSHVGFMPEVQSAYKYRYAGENLAKDYDSNQETVNAWLNSPEHLSNITDPHYTRTCVATDTYQNKTYAVQEFASF